MRIQCSKNFGNGCLENFGFGYLSGFTETVVKRADFGLKAKKRIMGIAVISL